jgi:hypothetical protein
VPLSFKSRVSLVGNIKQRETAIFPGPTLHGHEVGLDGSQGIDCPFIDISLGVRPFLFSRDSYPQKFCPERKVFFPPGRPSHSFSLSCCDDRRSTTSQPCWADVFLISGEADWSFPPLLWVCGMTLQLLLIRGLLIIQRNSSLVPRLPLVCLCRSNDGLFRCPKARFQSSPLAIYSARTQTTATFPVPNVFAAQLVEGFVSVFAESVFLVPARPLSDVLEVLYAASRASCFSWVASSSSR